MCGHLLQPFIVYSGTRCAGSRCSVSMDLANWPDEGGSVVLCPSAADAAVRRELAIRLLQTGELINAEILQILQSTHVLLLKASLQTYTKVDHLGGYSQTPIPRYQPAKNGGHGIWPASLHLPKEVIEAGGECSMEAQRNLDRIRSILQKDPGVLQGTPLVRTTGSGG